MPVLDTSFLIRLQAGDKKARALLSEVKDETLVVPPWVVVEYLTGHTGNPERVIDGLDRAFTLVQTSPAWALGAAAMRKELHERGIRIRLPDFWIATFARLMDTFVITQNTKHFTGLGIEVRSW